MRYQWHALVWFAAIAVRGKVCKGRLTCMVYICMHVFMYAFMAWYVWIYEYTQMMAAAKPLSGRSLYIQNGDDK